MIESIHIKNFKCYKDTFLEFSKGVNALVGLSDRGKSTVLRAIRWVVENHPAGNNYMSWWGGDAEVTITKGGNRVTRIRTENDKKNGYILNGNYLKSGVGVPDPVREVLNFSDVNLQMQNDQFFLLSKSPSEVARYLNKIVNLDKIDEAHKNINSIILDTNKESRFVAEELKNYESDIGKYNWIEEAGKDLQFYTEINIEMGGLINNMNELQLLIESIEMQEEQLNEMDWIYDAKVTLEDLRDIANLAEEEEEGVVKLQAIINEMKWQEEDRISLQEQVNNDILELEKEMPAICPLCEQEIIK